MLIGEGALDDGEQQLGTAFATRCKNRAVSLALDDGDLDGLVLQKTAKTILHALAVSGRTEIVNDGMKTHLLQLLG